MDVAKEALARGWVLSFAGNVTFKRNEELRQSAAIAPAGQLLVSLEGHVAGKGKNPTACQGLLRHVHR